MIYITYRQFHKLWDLALKQSSFQNYFNELTSPFSKNRINIRVLGKDYFSILKSVYNCAHYSISELLNILNLSNAEFSHKYCIPIRTVENWVYGKSACPDYIRFMIINDNKLLKMPRGVHIGDKPVEERKDKEIEQDKLEQSLKTSEYLTKLFTPNNFGERE